MPWICRSPFGGYEIERGDVLLSVELALDPDRPRPRRPVSTEAPRPRPVADVVAMEGVDPGTGIGTGEALRRDLEARAAWQGGFALAESIVVVELEGIARLREERGDALAASTVRAFVELVPFVLGGRDRVYRLGEQTFALTLPDATGDERAAAVDRLAYALSGTLQGRRVPGVTLVPASLDPALLADLAPVA